MNTPTPTPVASRNGSGTDVTHVYCCDPATALCGHDVADMPEVDEDGVLCVVCADLEETEVCPRCGYNPEAETDDAC